MTFPSPDNIESKVRIVNINGYYDKGKSRQNRAEAQAVVDEIARRLRSEELRKKSIGVVTFSIVQQALIEDLLSDLFIFHPELETLALECDEPLFIKNLENVQGDERDVILFSVGYGPDAEGRVSMNFGPLNRVGGERRLNVAVSRARYKMIIYSTLRSDMIDLNRTSSIGVAGLKRFLEYAEKGTRNTINSVTAQSTETTASIENIIADKLRSLGYTVHTDIGCSGYKIDIGIVDTENTSERRLNVAVSRARYKMIIYSTLRSDMIDLNRTSSIGVAGLKRFLEYAEKGTRNTINSVTAQSTETTASIENIIADKLRSLGYTVHTDIGCSGYKIDIGIVDTENTSNYQLGIICDGKNYKRTKTARDREIVQNNVLKALGWDRLQREITMKFHLYSKHHLPLLKSKLLPHLPHKAEYSKSTDRQRSLQAAIRRKTFSLVKAILSSLLKYGRL